VPKEDLFVFMVLGLSRGLNIGWKIRAILGAWVGGMDVKRVERTTRMLPDTAPLIPMEAQSPKQTCQTGLSGGRNIQPNPFADNLRQPVLLRQTSPQVVQNFVGGQPAVGAMPDKITLPVHYRLFGSAQEP
jgi:hypothetical protein